jgi:hypothetical protein
MATTNRWFPALLLVLCPTVLLAQEKEYPIRTFVPEKVGNVRTVQKKMTQTLDRVVKKDGKVTQEQHSDNVVEFDAKVETLEVDAQGRETRVQLTVGKLVLTAGKEKPQEGVKPGTVLIAELKGGKTVYAPKEKGQELSVLARHLLPRVMVLGGGPVSEHDVFETKQPQKVNGTWAADKKRLVEMFHAADPNLKPESASGQGQLVGIKKIDGKEFLDLHMSLSVQTTGAASAPDLVPESLAVKVSNRVLMPADASTGPVEQTVEVNMKQVLKGKDGTDLAGSVLEGGSKESATAKTVYLKK